MFERLHGWCLSGMGIGTAVWGVEQSGERRLLQRLASDAAFRSDHDAVIVDVGANHGDYAVAARQAFGTLAKIHCFEPADQAFQVLSRRLGQQPFTSLHRVGVSNRTGPTQLLTIPGHSQLASLVDPLGALTHQEPIELVTIDQWARHHSIEHITLMKIDVEGTELDVLQGAKDLLASHSISAIQFEYGLNNRLLGTCLRDFASVLGSDYRIFRILPNGVAPFDPSHLALDIGVSATNYLAISRSAERRCDAHRPVRAVPT